MKFPNFLKDLETCLKFGILSTGGSKTIKRGEPPQTIFYFTARPAFRDRFPLNVYTYTGRKQLKEGVKKLAAFIDKNLTKPRSHDS